MVTPKRKKPPIVLGRWTLQTKYILFTVFGYVAFHAGVPSLDLSTPAGYRPIWALFIVLAGLVCIVSFYFQFERIEFWALLTLISFAGAYVWAIAERGLSGDPDLQALSVVIIVILVMPIGRWIGLLPKGKRK